MHPRRVICLAALVLAAVACGDDDETTSSTVASTETSAASAPDTSGPATGGDASAYCDSAIAIEQQFGTLTGPPDPTFFGSLIDLVDDAAAAAPADLVDPIATMRSTFEQVAASGDFALLESDEVAAASDIIHGYEIEECFVPVDLALEDYRMVSEYPIEPGRYSFELTNSGLENHVAIIARAKEGSAEAAFATVGTADDPEAAFDEVFETVGQGAAMPGEESYAIAELTSGSYVVLCPIPLGSVAEAGFEGTGPPHFVQGMVDYFEVG